MDGFDVSDAGELDRFWHFAANVAQRAEQLDGVSDGTAFGINQLKRDAFKFFRIPIIKDDLFCIAVSNEHRCVAANRRNLSEGHRHEFTALRQELEQVRHVPFCDLFFKSLGHHGFG